MTSNAEIDDFLERVTEIHQSVTQLRDGSLPVAVHDVKQQKRASLETRAKAEAEQAAARAKEVHIRTLFCYAFSTILIGSSMCYLRSAVATARAPPRTTKCTVAAAAPNSQLPLHPARAAAAR